MTRHGLDSSVFPSQPLRPDESFPFRVVRQLGAGGMARVYLAQDSTGQSVALKLLHNAANPKQCERLEREGRMVATLSHPNVVRLVSSGTFGGRPYLAYQLVEDARELHVAFEGLGLVERVELLVQVAEGVGHAHGRGVVHRDLKPSNVLVDAAGRPHVADFGIGLTDDFNRMTKTGALVGTPHWMSPEQVAGRRDLQGPRTDVWALGVMLYQALTDSLPFQGGSLVEITVAIANKAPASPRRLNPAVSPALEAVCKRALSKDPAARYADGCAFGDALAAALHAPPTPRSSRALLLLLVIPLALLGAFGVTLLRSAPGPQQGATSGADGSSSATADLELADRLLDEDEDRARALILRVLDTHPQEAAAWRLLGQLEVKRRPAEAVEAYRRALEVEEDAETYAHHGFALHLMGDTEAGLAAIQRGLELDRTEPQLHARLAAIFVDRGEAERALSSAKTALRLDPRSTNALNTQGMALMELGRYEESKRSLRACLAIDRDATVLRNLAWLHAQEYDYAGAVRTINEALALEPTNAEFMLVLGVIQLNGKDDLGAIEGFGRTLALDPTFYDAYYYRGIANARAGYRGEALLDLQTFLDKAQPDAPQRPDARRRLRELEGGGR